MDGAEHAPEIHGFADHLHLLTIRQGCDADIGPGCAPHCFAPSAEGAGPSGVAPSLARSSLHSHLTTRLSEGTYPETGRDAPGLSPSPTRAPAVSPVPSAASGP